MLHVIGSPLASLPPTGRNVPAEAAAILERLHRRPHRWLWVVPTENRAQDLRLRWPAAAGTSCALPPRILTPEGLVAEALAAQAESRNPVGDPERTLRLSRAWQEVTGRPAGSGLSRQLDRLVTDWLAVASPPTTRGRDRFEALVRRYLRGLAADRRIDPVAARHRLAEHLADTDSLLTHFVRDRLEGLIFDGFHRLDPAELLLIAALARHADVLLWLTGVAGQVSGKTLEAVAADLRVSLVPHEPPAPSPLVRVGRSLFPTTPAEDAEPGTIDGLFALEPPSPSAEVEAVAARIKADLLADDRLSPAEIAVVVPAGHYLPLLADGFRRHGVPVHLPAQSLPLAQARAVRVLIATLQMVRGQWRQDLMLDYLTHPLVRRRLKRAHRLHELFDQRLRTRPRLGAAAWFDFWQRGVEQLDEQVRRLRSGEARPPRSVNLSAEEFALKIEAKAKDRREMLESLRRTLEPVRAIEQAVDVAEAEKSPLQRLAKACVDLLRWLKLDQWLASGATDEHVAWADRERDQLAYLRLLGVLQALGRMPADRLPRDGSGRPDAMLALQLALDGSTYRVSAGPTDGVQVLDPAAVVGRSFRHVYALGLTDDRVPPPPEEGVIGQRRRQHPGLARQQQQRDGEATWQFAQLFESARERLVLVRPVNERDRPVPRSRFLAAVEALAKLPPLPAPAETTSLLEAAAALGRAAASAPTEPTGVADLWPAGDVPALRPAWDALSFFRHQPDWPRRVVLRADPLLRLLFPPTRPFSASDLETYAACPFRYFGTRVLHVDERDADLTRQHYGSLVHRVFQSYYEQRRAIVTDPDAPLPPTTADDRDRLLQLFQREWDMLGEEALPPDLHTLFHSPAGVLDLFLEAVSHFEAGDENYGNILVEFELPPVPLGTDSLGREVRLSGTIDRVDAHRIERHRVIILDYKTGRLVDKNDRRKKAEDGRLLQLPLYGAALVRLRAEVQVVGGAYLYLNERKRSDEKTARHALGTAGQLLAGHKPPEVPFDPEAARQQAIRVAESIRGGRFSLTLHTRGKDAECTSFCPLRHACRHPGGYRVVDLF